MSWIVLTALSSRVYCPNIPPYLLRTPFGAPPEPLRSFPVAPLIGDQRGYGEAPWRLRRGPRAALVQGWRNWRPQTRLFGAQRGVRTVKKGQRTAALPGTNRFRKPDAARNRSLGRQFFHCLANRFPQYSRAYGIRTPAVSVSSHRAQMAEPLGAAADLSRVESGRNGACQPSLRGAPCHGEARSNCPSFIFSTCSPTPPARDCMWATRKATLPPTFSPATAGRAATTCCIRWAGTPSACLPSNTPSRPASIRARPPSRTSPPSRGRSSRSASATIGAANWTPPTRLLPVDAVDFPQALQLLVQSRRLIRPSQSTPSRTRPSCKSGKPPARRT